MRFPTLVFVFALTAGCASQPATPTAPVSAAARPAPPATPVAAVDATGNTVAKVTAPPGFKAKTLNGQTVYCKKTARIGTRFETETCVTASEAAQLERQAEADREMLRKNQTICTGGACGGG